MRDRCEGSLQPPAEVTVVDRPPDRLARLLNHPVTHVQLGACPTCGAWLSIQPNGTLKAHVNWDRRKDL